MNVTVIGRTIFTSNIRIATLDKSMINSRLIPYNRGGMLLPIPSSRGHSIMARSWAVTQNLSCSANQQAKQSNPSSVKYASSTCYNVTPLARFSLHTFSTISRVTHSARKSSNEASSDAAMSSCKEKTENVDFSGVLHSRDNTFVKSLAELNSASSKTLLGLKKKEAFSNSKRQNLSLGLSGNPALLFYMNPIKMTSFAVNFVLSYRAFFIFMARTAFQYFPFSSFFRRILGFLSAGTVRPLLAFSVLGEVAKLTFATLSSGLFVFLFSFVLAFEVFYLFLQGYISYTLLTMFFTVMF